MSTYFKVLFPLVTLIVPNVAGVRFTFPVPGIYDYVFAAGDTAIIQWEPTTYLSKVTLNCGPTPDVHDYTTGMECRWIPQIESV